LTNCRQHKSRKTIRRTFSGAYGEDSYSLDVLNYCVREFKAQRTDLYDDARPGRPFTDVSA
jgi:hypothetical protein